MCLHRRQPAPFSRFQAAFPHPRTHYGYPRQEQTPPYKTGFNRTRGILMAVAETAIGQGKSSGERSSGEAGGGNGSLKTHSGRDLCKKALPPDSRNLNKDFRLFLSPNTS